MTDLLGNWAGIPVHIGMDLAKHRVERIPAHPLIKWLAKFFRIDPWVEITIYDDDKTAYWIKSQWFNGLVVRPEHAMYLRNFGA
jgi:hypothetical protein